MTMDSPSLQSSPNSHPQRLRSHTPFSAQSSTVNNRGAIQKRINDNNRNRSISVSQADRLYRLAAEQHANFEHPIPSTAGGIQWITPQHSPQPQPFTADQLIEPFPLWTAPTPPRSDSGIPTLSVDANEEPVTTGISVAPEFALEHPSASSAEMSSLGFLLPSTYGGAPYESESNNYAMDQSQYIPPMRMSQPTTTSGTAAYAQTSSSSPALYQSRTADASSARRPSDMPAASASPYDQSYRRVSNPYEGAYSMPPSQSIPSISGLTQSPLPSPGMNATSGAPMMPQYDTSSMSRSPNMYQSNPYGQSYTTAPANPQMYAPTQQQNMSYPPPFVGSSVNEVMAKPMAADSSIRVLNQRPKPQCWEHGCNGRQFSTFSNLLRHQREKSGTASKSYCPKCGAEFTRTTARNGHLAHDKCTKQRRSSDGK
ncbi:hypothetical protein AC578_740 [Pseudocercospora eumusae]|uniref:C2H2-type domain-containing protein n=1 Tax=Pseudocercospora eumusae TaxID=321146 RepID=A0A139HMX7_9PEZI|nr:hypothetical protein AC578_740 [Pseudocercospora eumusae]